MTFFDPLYWALASIGYTDPLHPPFTHYPIALVSASLFFGLAGYIWRRPGLWPTAKHCLVLAWLFFFPTVLFGFMDWQYYYHGVWMGPIVVKIVLTCFLFVLLSIGLILVYKGWSNSRVILLIYAVSFLTVVVLGYFGGKMVYEAMEEGKTAAAVSSQIKAGKEIFAKNCLACHPNGGNIITPQAPLRDSQKLMNFQTFLAYNRKPRLANGERGAMPDFPASQISDKEMGQLYGYVIYEFGKPKPKEG